MSSATEARRGVVGLLLLALVVLAALVFIARYPGALRPGRDYHARFVSVGGLNRGADVRYGGLPVGTVTGLDVDVAQPAFVRVHFKVRGDIPLHADTRASIGQVGFLGEPYLHLQPGTRAAAPLPEGAYVATDETMSITDAMRRLATFFDRADSLVTSVERLAASDPLARVDRTLDQMTRTLARVDTLAGRAGEGTERVFTRIEDATARLVTVLDRSDRLVASLDTTMRATAPELGRTQREALAALTELRVLLADLRSALDDEGGMDAMVRDLAAATASVARLTARLERDPTSVLQRRPPAAKPAGPPARN